MNYLFLFFLLVLVWVPWLVFNAIIEYFPSMKAFQVHEGMFVKLHLFFHFLDFVGIFKISLVEINLIIRFLQISIFEGPLRERTFTSILCSI